MAPQSATEKGLPIPGSVAQQCILQQAEAVASTQTNSRTTIPNTSLQETDLLGRSENEDELPPPAYGDTYGEIRNEKDGLGTSASVSDDGRVNIRINQLNRRLSQIFTPALRQQMQRAQEDDSPAPPYIPPSLGDQNGVPPPSLNVVIQVVGSRGDVQPFVALGKILKKSYGHRVRLATHPNFKDFVLENGLEFFSIGGDPSRLMAFMVKNPGLMPGFSSLASGDVGQRRKDVAEYIQGCWRSCFKADDGTSLTAGSESSGRESPPEHTAKPFIADCIIANPPSFAHIHCAEKLGIPLHVMFTMPYSPTTSFPHPLANIKSSNADPQLTNYMSYAMIEILTWQGLGDLINRFRSKCLGLDPVSLIWAPGMLHRLKVPHTYCWSPALIPKPKDWSSHISIAGFYLLNLASSYTPTPELQAFLDAGPPPVYIGFGSIVLEDPDAMTELVFEAARQTGQRILLSKGWGGMGADDLRIPNNVFMLDNVPHDWLFKHVSCVVHHGGAGTTAAGISAGRPTLVVPFFGDQAFWGAMVARAGAGPDPIPHRQLTAENLADAINFCSKPESQERAQELASKIAGEQGSETGAQSFHQHLDIVRLRCSLAPSRAAVWRIRRTQIRLSPFAACTLANANLLDFHDLKLFRPHEYNTDEGPWDPISGFGTAVFGALSSMTMGLADIPSETAKAVLLPFKYSRHNSRASLSSTASRSQLSLAGGLTTATTSPGRSQTSLNAQEPLARVPSSSKSLTSNVESSTTSTTSQGQHQFLSQDRSSKGNRDMLRPTGAHTSKGIGRIVKTAIQSPMKMSMGITEGFHNAPKLWGDETVRPAQQVTDLKSGAKAIGKEFAYGFYDGITGLVTQPWEGAQKGGTSGFFKGVGKGIGGFATKPGAALFGIPSYFMKGVHKEVQKLFGSNVQNYIVGSRVAQGYEEWLRSSEEEKQDVIERWEAIQKYVKKRDADAVVQDILDAQRKTDTEVRGGLHQDGRTTNYLIQDIQLTTSPPSTNPTNPTNPPSQPHSSLSNPPTPADQPLPIVTTSETIPPNPTTQSPASQPPPPHHQHQQQDHRESAEHEALHQALLTSASEAEQDARETAVYEQHLQRALEESLWE